MQTPRSIGLQALTPIYGQMIQTAPGWSGPYQMPAVPPTRPPIMTPAQSQQAFYQQAIQSVTVSALMVIPLFL